MVNISKRRVGDDVMEKIFQLFFEAFGNVSDREEFTEIVHDILSPTERIMIAKRITIIFLLMKGIDHVTIGDMLKVSPTTVLKFRNIMEKSKGIVKTLEGTVRNEKITSFFKEIWLEFHRPGTPGVNWTSAWQSKIDFEKKKARGI